MATYTKIVNVTGGSIHLDLPKSFKEKRVEVTVRTPVEADSASIPDEEKTGKDHPLAKFIGSIPDFPDIEDEGDFEVRDSLP